MHSDADVYSTHRDVGRPSFLCFYPTSTVHRFIWVSCTPPTRMLVDLRASSIPDLYPTHKDVGRLFVDFHP
eukprot:12904267-Prorocentrum_lima.AAC.1